MKSDEKSESLHTLIRRKISIWGAVLIFGTLTFSFISLAFLFKYHGEQYSKALARSLAIGFRSPLLDGDVRYVLHKINRNFEKEGVSKALIRDQNFREIQSHATPSAPCQSPSGICWSGFRSLKVVYPIYYDLQKEHLFRYLELSVSPPLSWVHMVSALIIILTGLAFPTMLLFLGVKRTSGEILDQLNRWFEAIRLTPRSHLSIESVPYREWVPIHQTLDRLGARIEQLARRARESGERTVISGLGHDLRQDVSQLSKLFRLLRGASPERREKLESTTDGVLRKMSRKVQQIGILKNSPSRNLKERNEVCQISSLASRIVKEWEIDSTLRSKKVQLKLQCDEDSMAKVSETDFERIFQNLLENAICWAPQGSRIDIQVSEDEGNPKLSVKDSGIGLTREVSEQMFECGFTTQKEKGTGLGLPVVQDLVDQNGAKLSFKSEQGRGTEFSIAFRGVNE